MCKILVGHLGIMHADFKNFISSYKKYKIDFEIFNILKDDLRKIKLSSNEIIDLRNCRGYHEIHSFQKHLTNLEINFKNIPTIPSMKMIKWSIDKSKYLEDLKNIKKIPSKILKKNDISVENILNFIDKNTSLGIVLKPLIGSRAYQIIRIRKKNQKYDIYIPHRRIEKKESWTEEKTLNRNNLKFLLKIT
ncbi:MAG: hypothetical protein B6I24_01970 [Bacteroidetes bacterium 4572_128]|nr:MAG: hypothetical protein B6I24_01970 [Bacteroidetes bacterium 4572_128]